MRVLTIIIIALSVLGIAKAETPEFNAEVSRYQAACSKIGATNVDCQCVGRLNATWSHLSPSTEYKDYLYQRYRFDIGLASTVADALGDAVTSFGGQDAFQMAEVNSYDRYDRQDPRRYDYVRGCVMADAPRPAVPPMPKGIAFQEFVEEHIKRVNFPKVAYCMGDAYAKIFPHDQYYAMTTMEFENSNAQEVGRDIGVSAERAIELTTSGRRISSQFGDTRDDPGGICMARFAAEDRTTGALRIEYARSALARAGKPLGLEMIDVSKPPPKPDDVFGDAMRAMTSVRDEMKDAPSLDEVMGEFQDTERYKQTQSMAAATPGSLSSAQINAACVKGGETAQFCNCFSSRFESEIVPRAKGGAAALALPVIAGGLSPAQMMSLSMAADQSDLMELIPLVNQIDNACR